MPPRSRRAAAEDETADTEAPEPGGHVVLVDMLVYKVPGRRPHTWTGARAPRGTRVELDPDLNDIEHLEDLKAVAPDDGSRYKRTTAKVLAEAAGGREDPVKAPENLFDVTDEDVTPSDQVDADEDEPPTPETPADDPDDES